MNTRASVIVITFNSARWLPRCMTALAAQTEPNFELIVLDNASRAEERPQQSELPKGARLIQSENNLGFAGGNNLAAREARSPLLILLNADAFPAPDWLSHLVELANAHPQAAAIGSTQWRADAEGIFDGAGDVMLASGHAYRANFGKARRHVPPLGETFAACGAAMVVRRDAFEAIGGFDENYFCFGEDVDLCFRLRLRGYAILQSPQAVVHHVGGGLTGSRSAFARFHGARNRLWTFVKCMPAQLLWPLLPLHLILTGIACTIAIFTGGRFAAWRGFIAGVRGLNEMWRSRRELQNSRTVSWTKIASRLAWNPALLVTRAPAIFPLPQRPPGRDGTLGHRSG